MQHLVIAIDGPAASGKSSVSRALAQRLHYTLVNTGVMYRAVTWYVLQSKVEPSDAKAVEELLQNASIECGARDGQSFFHINGSDGGDALVSPAVNASVSKIASQTYVRRKLVEMQRCYARNYHLVMEGRDIGTAVFPDTPYKFYIDASPEVRASRRSGQGLHDSVVQRDAMDSSRKDSPLMIAPDAEVIDTSFMSLDDVVSAVLKRLHQRGVLPSGA